MPYAGTPPRPRRRLPLLHAPPSSQSELFTKIERGRGWVCVLETAGRREQSGSSSSPGCGVEGTFLHVASPVQYLSGREPHTANRLSWCGVDTSSTPHVPAPGSPAVWPWLGHRQPPRGPSATARTHSSTRVHTYTRVSTRALLGQTGVAPPRGPLPRPIPRALSPRGWYHQQAQVDAK